MSEPHQHTPGCGHNTVALYCDHCGELTHWPDPCPVRVAVAAERERCALLAEQHGIRYSKPVPCNCGGDRCPGQRDEWSDFADLLRATND